MNASLALDRRREVVTDRRPLVTAPPRRVDRGALATGARWLLAILLLAVAGGMVYFAPAAAGTDWHEVGHTLSTVGPAWMFGLTAIWIAGLWSYGIVMTASMPGLSPRQALSLNLAGSAVANSVPLGGAVSLGLVTAMSRSWGFTRSSVTTFLMLTNLWNVLIRLLFGALAVAWFLTAGPGLVTGPAALIVAGLAVLLVLAVAAILVSEKTLAWLGRSSGFLAERLPARFRPSSEIALPLVHEKALLDLRFQMMDRLRSSWLRLTIGMLGYIVLLALLLEECLRALGNPQPVILMLAVVGIERLVTALPITPGGAGAAEISLVACLTAAGVSGVHALAAALLYRFFTFIAEFPAGAAVALGWHLHRSRRTAHSGLVGDLARNEPIA